MSSSGDFLFEIFEIGTGMCTQMRDRKGKKLLTEETREGGRSQMCQAKRLSPAAAALLAAGGGAPAAGARRGPDRHRARALARARAPARRDDRALCRL